MSPRQQKELNSIKHQKITNRSIEVSFVSGAIKLYQNTPAKNMIEPYSPKTIMI